MNNIFSELLRPIHGVSQGSPLSPILFILYASDISQPNHIFMFLSQFADDIAIWAAGKDFLITNNRLQPYLDKLNKLCKLWRMRLKPGKTKVMNFWKGKQQIKNCSLTMNGHKLEIVEKTRFLGLLLDYNLNFKNHFEELLNSIKGLYIKLLNLKSKNFKVTSRTIINLYKTFIRNLFEYGNSATCFLNKSNLQNLEQIQLNILLFALNIQKGIKNDIIRKSVNVVTIQDRIIILRKGQLKKAISNNPDIEKFINTTAFKGSNAPLYVLDA